MKTDPENGKFGRLSSFPFGGSKKTYFQGAKKNLLLASFGIYKLGFLYNPIDPPVANYPMEKPSKFKLVDPAQQHTQFFWI